MTQSALTVGLLLLMFVLFVAAKGRLSTYTGVLWGTTDGKGGVKETKNPFDKEGDGFDMGDAADLAAKLLPYPFGIPFDLFSEQ